VLGCRGPHNRRVPAAECCRSRPALLASANMSIAVKAVRCLWNDASPPFGPGYCIEPHVPGFWRVVIPRASFFLSCRWLRIRAKQLPPALQPLLALLSPLLHVKLFLSSGSLEVQLPTEAGPSWTSSWCKSLDTWGRSSVEVTAHEAGLHATWIGRLNSLAHEAAA